MKKQKITLGSVDYNVEMMPMEDLQKIEGLEDASAGISELDARIIVSSDIPVQIMKQCFFHEIVHGILIELGMTQLNSDEGFVDSFAKQMYTLFHRNNLDKIMKFLEDGHVDK